MTSLSPEARPGVAPASAAGASGELGSDRDRLLGALARSDALFNAVLAQMPAALLLVEAPSGGLVYWNGKRVSHQYLDAPVREIRDVHFAFGLPRVETGTLVIRVVGGTGVVRVDGVAILQR